jgi:hypothetical protein
MTCVVAKMTRAFKRVAVRAFPVILLSACGGGTAALDSAATAHFDGHILRLGPRGAHRASGGSGGLKMAPPGA